ncbi:ABC transporter ATP-binding protein/permease [Eubacteriales bacterium OttesenSCG-928-M02]|nr:ABC transporter ATP-binding protein/permease [Eubacteriales bacterium OttesenSCG-928-M02]
MPPHGRRPLTQEEKANRPKITWPLLKRIFGYLKPYWPQLALVLVTIIVSSYLSLLPSMLTGRIIDDGFIGGNLGMLLTLLAASLGVLLLSNLIGVIKAYINAWVAQHITYDMRNAMYAHMLQMSHRFFTSSKQGEIITRMTSDIESVRQVITDTLSSIISNVAVLTIAVIAMYQTDWVLATAGCIMVPLFIIPTRRVGQKRWAITAETQKKNDEVNQILSESLGVSGQMLVKLFTNEGKEYQNYEAVNRDMTNLKIKETMVGRWFHVAMSTFTSAGPLLIYFIGGLLMLRFGNTTLTVGGITVMVALLERMYRPVNSLLTVQTDVIRSMALFVRIFEYFDMPIEVENKPNAIVPSHMEGAVAFENVSFSYNPEQPILKDISFAVPAGKSVAIVGPSGAGKSTIINLIPRLYDVSAGRITLDGRDIRDVDLTFLRQNIGLVTQDAYLFNGTIRENLLYAKESATEKELVKACEEANIHDFILSLPQGYDTQVGNRGVKLSGGEKQRVSIARVILKDPKLIILDEATSSLDSITESQIQDAIDPLLSGRTSIIIAHRLSTIMAADEILVVKDGRIVETGTHKSLLANSGVYRELYETQFRKVLQAV